MISAEHFLLKNNYEFIGNEESDLKIQKWRMKFEEKNDLERDFFQITCIEDYKKRTERIKNMMKSEYGKNIKKWLKTNFNEL